MCTPSVSPEHLGLVRSQLNEVTLTVTKRCVPWYVRVGGLSISLCVRTCMLLCDWQAQTVCDVLINHIDSLLLR